VEHAPVEEGTADAAPDVAAEEAAAPAVLVPEDAPLPIDPPAPRGPVFETLPEVWVLELSSFQLDGVSHFEPTAGAL
ncbi:hypothetical protein Q6294_34840, partial [Klebsiella pneumoniae]